MGLLAIILPSLLTLLKAGNDFADSADKGFTELLSKLGLKSYLHEEAKLISTGILLIVTGGIWLGMPTFSKIYNVLGHQNYQAGDLGSAESDYQKAIALNADHTEAHYNLGRVYEDLQDIKQAKTEYWLAVKSGLAEANNNLARLYILEDKPSQAVSLLVDGLKYPEKKPKTRYSLLKNLGWARLKQAEPQLAQSYLEAAIKVYQQQPQAERETFTNAGSAYCLLAQSFEQQKQEKLALEQWQKCCQFGSVSNPDEDRWLVKAHKKLEEVGKENLCLVGYKP